MSVKLHYVGNALCPSAWEFEADTHIVTFWHLQNKILPSIGNFPRLTLIHDMDVTFSILFICDCITKLCRQQAQVINSHENSMFTILAKVNPDRKYRRPKLCGGHAYDRSDNNTAMVA
jgi:hypothetical protein